MSGERYKTQIISNTAYPLKPIEELFESIRNGRNVEQIDEVGNYRVTRIQTIADKTVDLEKTKWTNDEVPEDYFMEEGDILLSHINSFEHLAKSAIFKGISEKVVHGTNLIRFKPNKNKIVPEYAAAIFKSEFFIDKAKTFAQKAVNQASLRVADIKSIQIPLPPLSVQEEIVAEIEGYQKIIDGAKMVVENYKPKIDIDSYRDDPEWEMVELGEVCEVNPKKSELANVSRKIEVSFVPMADINENEISFHPKQVKPLGEVIKGYTYFKEDDVLLAKVTPCFENGKAGIAKGLVNGIGFGSSEYFVLRPNDKILPTWIYLNVITNSFREKGKLNITGTGGLQRVPPDFIKSTLIPLPAIDIQRQIVSRIEKEQELVNANKQLIELFEQKIKDRIAKVWGEGPHQGEALNAPNEQDFGLAAEPLADYKTK